MIRSYVENAYARNASAGRRCEYMFPVWLCRYKRLLRLSRYEPDMLRYLAFRNSLSRCQASISWKVWRTGLEAFWRVKASFRSAKVGLWWREGSVMVGWKEVKDGVVVVGCGMWDGELGYVCRCTRRIQAPTRVV